MGCEACNLWVLVMVVVVCVGGYCFIDGKVAEVADAGVKGVAWGSWG